MNDMLNNQEREQETTQDAAQAAVQEAVPETVQKEQPKCSSVKNISGGGFFGFIAVIIWIIGVIAGIVSGIGFGILGFGAVIGYWVGAFLLGMIFMGIALILGNQKALMMKLDDISLGK